jgi:ferredoxin-NADP reductase
MGFLDRYRRAPPSVFGRTRHDVVLGVADAALAGLWGLSGAIRRMASPPEADRTIALTVADRHVVAHDQDVIALTLVGEHLPRWHPGAHIDIHLPSGLVRQYSLCGDPAIPDSYRIAVRRIPDGGGGSIEMHDLTVGASITTHGPRNAFPLTVPGYGSPARRFRFIAGGIGITPILPMLRLAQSRGVAWSMVYAGRSRDSLPFVDEVSRFAAGRAGNSAEDRIQIRTDDVGGLPTATELLGDCRTAPRSARAVPRRC